MFTNVPVSHSFPFQGSTITLQTGLLAKQASASVLATMGETTVLAAVVVGNEVSADYFPLQVVYEERLYASGKIKGSRFIKREGKPSENAILTGRMIDRSLRSLFDKNLRSEVQVVITVLSLDEVNPPDLVSVLAASAALKLAVKDFLGPVSSVRVGRVQLTPTQNLMSGIKKSLSAGKDISDFQRYLEDLCNVLELSKDDEKELFRDVFDSLAAKNPEWALTLKNLYQQSSRAHKAEILSRYETGQQIVVCPTYLELQHSSLDLVVSGDGQNIMMVEAGAHIINEEEVGQCLDVAMRELQALTQFQSEFVSKAQSEFGDVSSTLAKKTSEEKYQHYWKAFQNDLETALYSTANKEQRNQNIADLRARHHEVLDELMTLVQEGEVNYHNVVEAYQEKISSDQGKLTILQAIIQLEEGLVELDKVKKYLSEAMYEVIRKLVHANILDNDRRLDGRRLDETRQIMCQVGVLPRTHGSSLFQRGETQVLNVLTLGTMRDAQLLDDMEDFEEQTKRYIHHYNFPPYSVGETGRYSGPGRREIGHGALAEKALLPVLPTEEEFPYTIRLVSECLGSNGSTSMASTCASCLSLLDAGVPIKDMVAGVAMGLVLDSSSGKFKVLTDILGDEDHYGDMDFKVTGTKDGITAIQLDNKVAGLTATILKQALVQAKAGRMHILGIMQQAISTPRDAVSRYAPGVEKLSIPMEKIGEVIGPSGKVIKGIIAKFDVEIDIEDTTGKTYIYGKNVENVKRAKDTISKMIREYTPGDIVSGKVYRIENYGVFVKIDGTEKEGMIHISQFKERVKSVADVVTMGQVLEAKVLEINDKGQISLTLK